MEFFGLWNRMRQVVLKEEVDDSVSLKLSENGVYTAKSAYDLFFIGRHEVPGTRELWRATEA